MMPKYVLGGFVAAGLCVAVLGVAVGQPLPVRGGSGSNVNPMPPHPAPNLANNIPSFDLATVRSVSLSCANEDVAQEKICDTNNLCTTARQPCFPYKCDSAAKTCAMTCSVDAHCSAGASCQAGKCQLARAHCKPPAGSDPEQVSIAPDGTETRCGLYKCNAATGDCLRSCGSTADCVPSTRSGSFCDGSHKCSI